MPFKNATFVLNRASATVPVAMSEPFKLVRLIPLPLNVPPKLPMKLFAELENVTELENVPVSWAESNGPDSCVEESVPSRLLAEVEKIAYGTGNTGCTGSNCVKALVELPTPLFVR